MTRTHDLLITNQLLYRLSYISIFTFGVTDLILTKYIHYYNSERIQRKLHRMTPMEYHAAFAVAA